MDIVRGSSLNRLVDRTWQMRRLKGRETLLRLEIAGERIGQAKPSVRSRDREKGLSRAETV